MARRTETEYMALATMNKSWQVKCHGVDKGWICQIGGKSGEGLHRWLTAPLGGEERRGLAAVGIAEI